MGLILNIALLALAFTYAVVSFGGDNWVKGDSPLYQRITKRGWFAIFFLLLTLAVGTAKEVLSQKTEADLKKERDALAHNWRLPTACLRNNASL